MLDGFVDAIARELGAAPEPDRIVPGRIVRFSTTGKRGDDAGWCKLFEDGRGGVFGNWRTGAQHTWHDRSARRADRQKDRERIAAAQAARAEEQAQRQAKAAERAQLIWTRAQRADRHPYLERKHVRADLLRVQHAHAAEIRGQFYSGGEPLRGLLLLVPMRDIRWRVQSLQAIDADGRKSFLKGARTTSLFHICGAEKLRRVPPARFADYIGICEGYATAWSLAHDVERWPTFAAFSAGNLRAVALEVRHKYPLAEIVVCGDADRNGVGQAKAEEAASAIEGSYSIPPFTQAELAAGLTDYNDYARLARVRSGV